jgi:hypothetical protein
MQQAVMRLRVMPPHAMRLRVMLRPAMRPRVMARHKLELNPLIRPGGSQDLPLPYFALKMALMVDSKIQNPHEFQAATLRFNHEV